MKIVLAATPAVGHVNPILSVAKILAGNGHEIVVTTSRAYADGVEAAGLRFHPLQGAADFDTRDMDTLFPERRLLAPGPPQLRFDMERIFVETLPDQFATLKEILRKFPADLIIADSMFPGTLPFLLQPGRDRPRIGALGTTVLILSRDDGAPFGAGLPPAQTPEELEKPRDAAAFASERIYRHLNVRLNRVLRQLGIEIPVHWLDSVVLLPDVFLQSSVPGFEYPRRHLPENIKFIGSLPPVTTRLLAEDVQQQLEAAAAQEKKIVLVTQGTATNDNFGQLLAPTLQAFAADPEFFVVATTGGRSPASIVHAFPANSLVREGFPLDKVFPFVDVLVTNGGYGTVTQALAAGVPIVAAGLSEDKPEVAALIAWCGAGINLRTSTPAVDAIRDAVQAVLADRRFASRASALADEFAQYETPREVEQALATLFQATE